MNFVIWRDESLDRLNQFYDDFEDDDEDDEDEMSRLRRNIASGIIKIPTVFTTPFCQVSSNDEDNIWFERQVFTGHSNFYITSEHAVKIMDVAGVDGLRIISPYSFAVCVGLCFFYGDVLADIESMLDVDVLDRDEEFDYEETNELLEENSDIIEEVMEELGDEEFWFVYILPNGKVIKETYDEVEDMKKRSEFFKECSVLSNGILLSSEDV